MIQWIALAVALDAESRAGQARDIADEANHAARSGTPLVIVRPVEIVQVPSGEPTWKLFGLFTMTPMKKVLAKVPWATYSIKKSDILNMQEFADEDGARFCRLEISPYAKITKMDYNGDYVTQIGILIPGSIEEITRVIGVV